MNSQRTIVSVFPRRNFAFSKPISRKLEIIGFRSGQSPRRITLSVFNNMKRSGRLIVDDVINPITFIGRLQVASGIDPDTFKKKHPKAIPHTSGTIRYGSKQLFQII
jgi:hypothetical protein